MEGITHGGRCGEEAEMAACAENETAHGGLPLRGGGASRERIDKKPRLAVRSGVEGGGSDDVETSRAWTA